MVPVLYRSVVTLVLVVFLAGAAFAQRALPSDPVLDAIRIGELLEIMAEESRQHGADLDASMLQGQGGEGWSRMVAAIHDPKRWEARMRTALNEALPETQVAPILGFVTSDQGQRIIGLELSARRALLDPTVDEASRAKLEELRAENAPILGQITRFVQANDLIDANVVGALNANYAFLLGLQEGTGGEAQGDMLGDVWAQEPEIRASTTDWVYGFLAMAYAPLEPGDLEAYIAFSESEAGQAFNAALFAGFDEMFVETSRATGHALGQMMAAEDI